MQFIITGTDTGIGKTLLASLLMASLDDYSYWKPIQSGLSDESDTEAVLRQSAIDRSRVIPERYRLQQPLSPHLSARLDHVTITGAALQLPQVPNLIIEGAGGVLVPINDSELFIDVFAAWHAPVLIATRSSLGTINHSLLTIEALRRRQIPIIGCVMIGEHNIENELAVSSRGDVTIIGRIPILETIDRTTLRNVFATEFAGFRTRMMEVVS